ncbi:RNA polymerase sigma-70 factor [Haliangium sp.]|uniref:RNA polymerase sigma-70 factor n=1 Tax=Haliangium sp. TaxID=2663208 RepID=UPI003D0B0C73
MPGGHERVFEDHRGLVFHIAYRMLGTVADAEDLVQETWLRWQRRQDGDEVRAPKPFLAQVVTRLAIERLREVQRRRESYPGPWLPAPLLADTAPGAGDEVARVETLRMGLLVMLERLRPVERAVFVLREGFDYDYEQIADIVGKSEQHCRQILTRARRHLQAERVRASEPAGERDALAARFLAALANRDLSAIEGLLAADVTYYSDGGGKVAAARNPLVGPDRVLRFLAGILGKQPADAWGRPAYVNGEPGLVLFSGGRVYAVMAIEIEAGRIRTMRAVSNPDKLVHVTT